MDTKRPGAPDLEAVRKNGYQSAAFDWRAVRITAGCERECLYAIRKIGSIRDSGSVQSRNSCTQLNESHPSGLKE